MNVKNPIIQLSVIVIVSIIGTFLFAYASYVLNTDGLPDSFISLWNSWDTPHYLNIAREGYSGSTVNERHLMIVFFPLYPFLIKVCAFIFQNYLLSGLVVSNIAYIFAAIYLYKLVLLDFDTDYALRTVIYLSVFPTAFYLHAAYAESLFLALTITSFYYARKSKWGLSGVLGMLAAMTRINGVILAPVILIEYLHQREFKKENMGKDILWTFLIGFGFIIYIILNYTTYGDPLKFLEIQSGHWGMNLSLPTKGLLYSWGVTNFGDPAAKVALGWFQIVFSMLGLILTIYSFFRLRLSYSLYALATWLLSTSTSFMMSVPRFMLTIFPMFIVLAILGRRKEVNYSIIFLSLLFYALILSRSSDPDGHFSCSGLLHTGLHTIQTRPKALYGYAVIVRLKHLYLSLRRKVRPSFWLHVL